MRKLIKHLRPFVWSILIIFVLLFAQAMADLSLPGYMANIVNVGIQQNGIENSVPQAISTSEFNKLTLFMTDNEKAQVTEGYILLSKQSLSDTDYAKYLKTYPQLATTPIYKLNTTDKTEIAQLNTILVKSIPPVFAIEQNGLAAYAGNTLQIPTGVDPFVLIAQLPPDQFAAIRIAAETQIKTIPSTLLTQYSVAYISAQYEALGMNMGSIQTKYMLRIGTLMLLLTLASVACSITVG